MKQRLAMAATENVCLKDQLLSLQQEYAKTQELLMNMMRNQVSNDMK